MNPRWMCDRISTWLKDAAVKNGPIPLGARALATRMRDLGTGCTRPDISWCGERRTHAKASPWISAVKALDKGVLLRLAGCDVMPLDQHLLAPAQDRPCRSVRRRCRRRTLVARRGFIRAAVDGLIDCRRGIDRAAIAPHFFISALT